MASMSGLRDGIAARLATISGLRVHDTVPGRMTGHNAIVIPDSVSFDAAMGRGVDDFTFVVTVLVPFSDLRSAQDALDDYLDGDGSKSVKAAIEGDCTLGGAAHTSRVTDARDYGQRDYGGSQFLAVDFAIDAVA